MWNALREVFPNMRFRFQVPFGSYHADFCSHRAKLIVEVDGGQHARDAEKDAARARFLQSEGYDVIRFWNDDVIENIAGVIDMIAAKLPSPPVGESGARRRMRGSAE